MDAINKEGIGENDEFNLEFFWENLCWKMRKGCLILDNIVVEEYIMGPLMWRWEGKLTMCNICILTIAI